MTIAVVKKHSVIINGHQTSISLEEPFFKALREIAVSHEKSVAELVTEIDRGREVGNLSSAVRVYVLAHYQRRTSD